MPMPRWVGRINKRVFNPREDRKGIRPVLSHTGRRSGRTYRTPLDAHRVDDGFVFILMYGSDSDWVQNIVASGTATLRVDNAEVPLDTPRIITEAEAVAVLPADTKLPPGILRVSEFLQMNLAA